MHTELKPMKFTSTREYYMAQATFRATIAGSLVLGLSIWAAVVASLVKPSVDNTATCHATMLRNMLIVDSVVRFLAFIFIVGGCLSVYIENCLFNSEHDHGSEYTNGIALCFRAITGTANMITTLTVSVLTWKGTCKTDAHRVFVGASSFLAFNFAVIAIFVVLLPCLFAARMIPVLIRLLTQKTSLRQHSRLSSYDPDVYSSD